MNGSAKPTDVSGSFATRFAAMVVKKWLKLFATIFLSDVIVLSMEEKSEAIPNLYLKILF